MLKIKHLMIFLVLLTFISTSVQAEEVPSGGEMMIDVILIRPLGVVSLALGSVLFVVSLPFTAISGSIKQSGKRLIVYPAKFTFTRKLGSFGGYSEELLYEEE